MTQNETDITRPRSEEPKTAFTKHSTFSDEPEILSSTNKAISTFKDSSKISAAKSSETLTYFSTTKGSNFFLFNISFFNFHKTAC